MDQVTPASQAELDAFVKGAMDRLGAAGVPDDAARQLLELELQKQAAVLMEPEKSAGADAPGVRDGTGPFRGGKGRGRMAGGKCPFAKKPGKGAEKKSAVRREAVDGFKKKAAALLKKQ